MGVQDTQKGCGVIVQKVEMKLLPENVFTLYTYGCTITIEVKGNDF